MHKFMRALHNYLGLILFIQIGLWFLSGLVMAYLPIEEVRGNHLRQRVNTPWQQATVSPQQVLSTFDENATLRLTHRLQATPSALLSTPVYQVSSNDTLFRFNAVNGEALLPLEKSTIASLAEAQYQGEGAIVDSVLLSTLPQEVQNLSAPLWQVTFDDDLETRFYIDPNTGAVTRVRTNTWRLFDFMWMLHIMDYKDRSNFNSPLLIAFSASAFLFTLTGVVLLYRRFKPRRRRSIFKGQSF